MSSNFRNKQKSLKRRFLLILGAIAFVCFLGRGLMVIFTDQVLPDDYGNWKIAFGGLIIVYSVLRFARLFKKDEDDEE
jgi:cytochrome c biogenesis protein CcdA